MLEAPTCCWKETVALGQIAWTVSMVGRWELQKSCANLMAPERNLEAEGKSRRAWNRVRSNNSLWKFPCWAVNETDENVSTNKVDFTAGAWRQKPSNCWDSSTTCGRTELSPKQAITAAPVCVQISVRDADKWFTSEMADGSRNYEAITAKSLQQLP